MLSFFSHFVFFFFQPRALFCTVHFLSGASRDVCDVAFRCLTHFAATKMSDDSSLRKKRPKKITHLCLSSDPLSLSEMLHPIHPSNNINQALYCQFFQFLLFFSLFSFLFNKMHKCRKKRPWRAFVSVLSHLLGERCHSNKDGCRHKKKKVLLFHQLNAWLWCSETEELVIRSL